MQRYAEDLTAGTTCELGEYLVSHDEIVEFARQWDPQSFHIDDEAAQSSIFGSVIASGIHTVGVFQRLAVLAVFNDWHMVAGRSMRDIQFRAPVRPGMTLRGQLRIDTVEPTRTDRSLVTMTGRILHEQQEILVLSFDAYVRRRP